MKHIATFLAGVAIVSSTNMTVAGKKNQHEHKHVQVTSIIQNFVNLADRDRGWKHFSNQLISALKAEHKYEDFIRELNACSDVCTSVVFGSSVSKRALMLSDHRDELPYQAREILSGYSFDRLTQIVKAYAQVDAERKGCTLTK